MNTESIDCRRVSPGAAEKPGDFHFVEDFQYITIWFPCDDWAITLPVQRGEKENRKDRVIRWGWDGNEDKPTLTPSLFRMPDKWHGHLTAGRLVSV